jgi:hypothetical protein
MKLTKSANIRALSFILEAMFPLTIFKLYPKPVLWIWIHPEPKLIP